MNGKYAEPVVEVLPETMMGHLPWQVAIGGGDNPQVHPPGPLLAHPLELSFLNRPEELALQRQRDLGDLVEEQRPAVGGLKASRPVARGACEGAPHVSEELTFEE